MSRGEAAKEPVPGNGPVQSLHAMLTGDDDARLCRDIPENQCRVLPGNFLVQIAAHAFSKIGDALADVKIVLPWLLGAVGAPVFFIGLLVPIRESLALLPQIAVGGFIRRFSLRKWFWVLASLVEGTCILAIALCALAGITGRAAGWVIVALLVIFSLARGIASVASKDTLGKTVAKGERGRVSGYAATVAGVVAVLVGLVLVFGISGAPSNAVVYAIVLAAGLSWFAAAASFALLRERPGATDGGRTLTDLAREQIALLARDGELRKFLLARALMIATALAGPVYVAMARQAGGDGLSALGWLLLASGLANMVSSSVWGMMADRSSRATMAIAAALGGGLGFVVLAARLVFPDLGNNAGLYAIPVFILYIAHAGVRIGRKTQVVDIAGPRDKGEYVALSNTLIGILLLIAGSIVAALMALGLDVALAALSASAFAGSAMALTMKNAEKS